MLVSNMMRDNIIVRDVLNVAGVAWLAIKLLLGSFAILLFGGILYIEFLPQTTGWFAIYLLVAAYLIRVLARVLGLK